MSCSSRREVSVSGSDAACHGCQGVLVTCPRMCEFVYACTYKPSVTSASSLPYLCSFSSIHTASGGAEVCPTIPPTEHRPPHTPDASSESGAEVPATLTCWSDPDPHTTEGASEGGAPTNNSQTHACSIST